MSTPVCSRPTHEVGIRGENSDAPTPQRPEMDVRDKLGNMAISTSSSSFNRKKSKVKDGDVKRQAQRLLKK